MKFKQIKDAVLNETYINSDMEIAGLNGDVQTVADMLSKRGLNPGDGGTVVELIQAGFSEEQALKMVK